MRLEFLSFYWCKERLKDFVVFFKLIFGVWVSFQTIKTGPVYIRCHFFISISGIHAECSCTNTKSNTFWSIFSSVTGFTIKSSFVFLNVGGIQHLLHIAENTTHHVIAKCLRKCTVKSRINRSFASVWSKMRSF